MRYVRQILFFILSYFLIFYSIFAFAQENQESIDTETDVEVEIIYVSGSVEVCSMQQASCRQAEEGMLLVAGDRIKTAWGSAAELAFDEDKGNVVRLNANTVCILLLKEDEKIELLEGEVFTIVGNLSAGSAFEIRTPTAIVGARGTEWLTRVEQDTTLVEAYENNTYVKILQPDGRPAPELTTVIPGHTTSVRRFQRPQPLQRIPEHKIKTWKELRSHIKERAVKANERRKLQRMLKPQPIKPERFKKDFQQRKPQKPDQLLRQSRPQKPLPPESKSKGSSQGPLERQQ
ncbi:MAG: FecR family protein [Candidatus Omnitrophica bacterium]|nr:FecR family protein [Candidatus Omnitrophota bacterium]